jgi:hypothetical protein
MAEVKKINPDYESTEYNNFNRTVTNFGTGKQGDTVRYINNAIQHIDVMQQAADALKNGDNQTFNSLMQRLNQEFGTSAPTTFDGLKQIVGTEIERAATGGVGAAVDRDRLMESMQRYNSPDQLKGAFDGFRSLFRGQANSLKNQYENGTPDAPLFRSGKFAFDAKLLPETKKALGIGGESKEPGSATPGLTPGAKATPEQLKTLPQPKTLDDVKGYAPGSFFVTPSGVIGRVPGTAAASAPAPAVPTPPAAPPVPAPGAAAAPAVAPPRPANVPAGSMYSPSRKAWRTPDGQIIPAGQ